MLLNVDSTIFLFRTVDTDVVVLAVATVGLHCTGARPDRNMGRIWNGKGLAVCSCP